MRAIFFVVFLTLLSGCTDPHDIVFGPEPIKQIAEQGEKFKKLSEEERTLLVGYLTITEMGKAFGAEIKPSTGRTVKEVLADARIWKEKMEAAEKEAKLKKAAAEAEDQRKKAEAEALRNKILAERKEISDKISSSVVVAIVDKAVLPKNYDAGRFSEMLTIKYAIENKSSKKIIQLKGRAIFKDPVGDEIGWVPVSIEEPIKPNQTIKTDTGRGWKLNSFSNGDIEKIASREFGAMRSSFEPESIAFEDGEVLKAPEMPN